MNEKYIKHFMRYQPRNSSLAQQPKTNLPMITSRRHSHVSPKQRHKTTNNSPLRKMDELYPPEVKHQTQLTEELRHLDAVLSKQNQTNVCRLDRPTYRELLNQSHTQHDKLGIVLQKLEQLETSQLELTTDFKKKLKEFEGPFLKDTHSYLSKLSRPTYSDLQNQSYTQQDKLEIVDSIKFNTPMKSRKKQQNQNLMLDRIVRNFPVADISHCFYKIRK